MNTKIKAIIMVLAMIGIIGVAMVQNSAALYRTPYYAYAVETDSNTPDLFMNVCCLKSSYELNGGLAGGSIESKTSFLQIPIKVEILNKSMKPQKNVKVNVEMNINGGHAYNVTKSTDSNGIANFGYSIEFKSLMDLRNKYPPDPTDITQSAFYVDITAIRGKDKVVYMTAFDIAQD